jgi:hypothetical protein
VHEMEGCFESFLDCIDGMHGGRNPLIRTALTVTPVKARFSLQESNKLFNTGHSLFLLFEKSE